MSSSVGLLERWDRHNQRILQWHNHIATEERRQGRDALRDLPWKGLLATWLVVAVMTRVLDHVLGFAWSIGILGAITVGCFSWLFASQRRKRRAWEARR